MLSSTFHLFPSGAMLHHVSASVTQTGFLWFSLHSLTSVSYLLGKNPTLSEFFGSESKFPRERLQMIHLKRWLATHNPSRMGQLHRRTKDWGGRWVWVSGENGCWHGLWKKWATRERQNSTLCLDLSSRKTALEIYQVKLSFQKNTKC